MQHAQAPTPSRRRARQAVKRCRTIRFDLTEAEFGEIRAAAEQVRESWLKTKAAARLIPCTFVGKHLRFSDDEIAGIVKAGARQPITTREPRPRRASA
jgi:hypothetical protein